MLVDKDSVLSVFAQTPEVSYLAEPKQAWLRDHNLIDAVPLDDPRWSRLEEIKAELEEKKAVHLKDLMFLMLMRSPQSVVTYQRMSIPLYRISTERTARTLHVQASYLATEVNMPIRGTGHTRAVGLGVNRVKIGGCLLVILDHIREETFEGGGTTVPSLKDRLDKEGYDINMTNIWRNVKVLRDRLDAEKFPGRIRSFREGSRGVSYVLQTW